MTIIIDASVALKWVIEEDGSEEAGALLRGEPLAAPDLLVVECANVLWAKARRRSLTRDSRRSGPRRDPGGAARAAACGRLCHRRARDSLRPRSDGLRQPLPRRRLGRTG